ncbi:MAG: extracellular solute-binding protein [Lentisphaeria bacterium]|nr:extracellular solute-binding protein [Lentisphaeria bacterium]
MRDTKKYEEIADRLLDDICQGSYLNGKLPSMSAIAKQFKVNLQTANRAVKLLEQQGVVRCHPGKTGTLIDQPRAAIVAQCSSPGRRSPQLLDQVFGWKYRIRLRFLHPYQNPVLHNLFQSCAEAFTQRYPWVEVEPVAVDNANRILSGEQPFDTALVIGRDLDLMNRRGMLCPVTDFVRRDPAFRQEDFCAGVWSLCSRGREITGIPFDWSVPLLCADKPCSTWEGLSEGIHPGKTGVLSLGLYSLIMLFIGRLSTDDDLQEKRPGLRRLVRVLKKLCSEQDGYSFWDSQTALNLFHPDRNTFLCGYYSSINRVRNKAAGWQYHPLPEIPGTPIIATECLAVGSSTRSLPEALLWMKFLTRTEIQRKFMSEPSFLPVRKELIDRFPDEFAGLLRRAGENALQPEMSSPALFRFYSSVYPLLKHYFDGDLPEEQLLSEVLEMLGENLLLDTLNEPLGSIS